MRVSPTEAKLLTLTREWAKRFPRRSRSPRGVRDGPGGFARVFDLSRRGEKSRGKLGDVETHESALLRGADSVIASTTRALAHGPADRFGLDPSANECAS